MSRSGDPAQGPWADPQTHLDTDPVNAEPAKADPATTGADDDASDSEDAGPVEPS